MTVKLYVEGGGDAASLRAACRQGFKQFLESAGLRGHMPRIVACGTRHDAYDSFCTAIENGEAAFLLVDAEGPVQTGCQVGDQKGWLPWLHLAQRQGDEWQKPPGAADSDCHLMTQFMEAWFLADAAVLGRFFGQGFQANKLPNMGDGIESVPKVDAYRALGQATSACKTKAPYGKGEHSFKLLALINADQVMKASPWANRFIVELKCKMGV